ncbi:ATP-dependent protease subunit HslV [Oceanithermus desulfurans NBRC 100063]|uniref:ATP-dependent protease subunit HslV n=3 Tax=Thermaceae TaxID=188786 RepID=A0A511RMF5_9DEIN|nr:ATP-dependent protease subunit HslV [Oceanithermus desulfurans NBRC 100063]
MMEPMHGTTILAVHKDGETAIAGDGQVTFGDTVMKQGAVKVRKLEDDVLVGFAGAVADALTLLEKFEEQLEIAKGSLKRAAVETVKLWRTDRILRQLEAMLIVADAREILLLSGTGEVIAPDEPLVAVGSGAPYALSAAKALYRETRLGAAEIAEKALGIAAEIDLYTNGNTTVLRVGGGA